MHSGIKARVYHGADLDLYNYFEKYFIKLVKSADPVDVAAIAAARQPAPRMISRRRRSVSPKGLAKVSLDEVERVLI
jgi:hypothetical protein